MLISLGDIYFSVTKSKEFVDNAGSSQVRENLEMISVIGYNREI